MHLRMNILFDLDGTLTDPKIGITKSVQYALERFGIHVDDLDLLEPFIGPPLMEGFSSIYQFEEEQCKQAISYYREYFSEQGIYENTVYPGIIELLQQLKKEDHQLFVATSKPTVFAEIIIKHFEMSSYFDFIGGSNLDGTRSSKGDVIRYVMDQHGLKQEQSVMIGDRKHDIIGAHQNQIPSIAVEYGYGSREELLGSQPTVICGTVKELGDCLKDEAAVLHQSWTRNGAI